MREQLVEDGELVSVEVEGVRGKRFVVRDEVDLLAAPAEPPPSVAFLSPFDRVEDAGSSDRCLSSTTSGTSSTRPRSGASATTCSRSSSATASSVASGRRSTVAGGPVQVLGLWWENSFKPGRGGRIRRSDAVGARRVPQLRRRGPAEWAPHFGRDKRLFLTRP